MGRHVQLVGTGLGTNTHHPSSHPGLTRHRVSCRASRFLGVASAGPLLQTPTPTPSHTDIPHGDTPPHTHRHPITQRHPTTHADTPLHTDTTPHTPHYTHRHPITHTTQTHIHTAPLPAHTLTVQGPERPEPPRVLFVDPQPSQPPASCESTSKGRRPAPPTTAPLGDFSPTPVHQPPKALRPSAGPLLPGRRTDTARGATFCRQDCARRTPGACARGQQGG